MNIQEQIEEYIAGQPGPKRAELTELHRMIRSAEPAAKLWFLDGKNDDGKIVSNPNIGYGTRTINYVNGSSREFYQIGLSANKSGISVYILGIEDKSYLAEAYGKDIGKATVTGYCIRFRSLKDIDVGILQNAIGFGFASSSGDAS